MSKQQSAETFQTTAALLAFDHAHIWHPYTSLPSQQPCFLIESAQGCTLKLADGRELIDGMASWWSAIHGYNHPVLNAAIHTQSQQMAHVMFGGLTHQPAIELAQLLTRMTPKDLEYIFYSDSGSVAVEVAMKMALQYWQRSETATQKTHFLSLRGGYHGDTFAAMSVCDPVTGMHHLFSEVLAPQYFAPRPEPVFAQPCTAQHIAEIEALCAKHHHRIAAIILEPIVQGAGGMYFYSAEYLSAVRQLCDRYDLLLIADEIATGFGRTGLLFACEHAGITPDILCLGKALTGGYMTLAATLCNHKVAQGIQQGPMPVLMHGPTFMANPLACAVATASIKLLLESDWQQNVQRIESRLSAGLKPLMEHSAVADVRVLGAIGVVEMHEPVDMQRIQPLFVEQGIWLRPFGKLIYTMPAYIMSDAEIDQLCAGIIAVIGHSD